MSDVSQLLRSDKALQRKRVEQVGGLCYRANEFGGAEVLFITTRQTKRLAIPKGWPISGLDPHQLAKQEAWESVFSAGLHDGGVLRRVLLETLEPEMTMSFPGCD